MTENKKEKKNSKQVKRSFRRLFLMATVALVSAWALIGYVNQLYGRWDDHEHRGAKAVTADPFDQPITDVTYLPQGWDEADSLWFYNATQGSNLLPYDFFLFLEQADSQDLFRSDENINAYRYLPQQETFSNPDGLPVGMAKDTYQGRAYMGFTCAACHTSQINYRGTGIRIDGGPSAADLATFLVDMATALERTIEEPTKGSRFVENVLNEGNYDDAVEIRTDLKKFATQIRSYTEVNRSETCLDPTEKLPNCTETIPVRYGYARLDAFGRIYNRVLQHVLSARQLKEVLVRRLPAEVRTAASAELEALWTSEDQTHLVARAITVLDPHLEPRSDYAAILAGIRYDIYNPANAPVSYPYLWDIPQHDYVQWTGLVSNGSLGPLGRNVGQVIGVFGTLDWQVKPGWTIESFLGGQGIFMDSHVDFKTSIDKRNLRRVEKHLRTLLSPEWPGDLVGAVDKERAESRGKPIFDAYCGSCHEDIERADPERRIIAQMSHADTVGTDPVLANNTVDYDGLSGILRYKYVDPGPGKILLASKSKVASLVKLSTRGVVTAWDPDKNILRRSAEWLYDTLKTLRDNKVKTTLKHGDYDPPTTNNPFAPLRAYKARPLNGIWATAPYLHNGSVPTLYDLLLPKREDNPSTYETAYEAKCGEPVEYRPDTFFVGSREFDPERVGFEYDDYDGFEFDTDIPGNSNAGHEYASGKTAQPNGDRLEVLCRDDRMVLLEYLKTL